MVTRVETQQLKHSDSDESLYEALLDVVNAPPPVVSHLIGSRAKQDRTELSRILKHLPLVREKGGRRGAGRPFGTAGADVLGTPFSARTPRASSTPRGGAQSLAPSVPATPRIAAATPPRRQPPSVSAKDAERRSAQERAEGEASDRVRQQLAEFGIDTTGMSASDVLKVFYARGSGSSYWLPNREAEKRNTARVTTPQSFKGVLSERAHGEVRRARDVPATSVHEHLDPWEIAVLGDACRSLRHFDETAQGATSEYSRGFQNRNYGMDSGRKKFVRNMI